MTRVNIVITFVILLLISGCTSTRDTSVVTHDQAVTLNHDSCFDHQTATVDTVKTRFDSVSKFLPTKWIIDTVRYQDPASMSVKQGRSTLTIARVPGGIRVTASCDSLVQLLVSRNREIYELRQQVDSKVSSSSASSVKVVYKTPLWMILLLVISVLIDVIIIVYTIKPRIL